jgi:hypothetical protein
VSARELGSGTFEGPVVKVPLAKTVGPPPGMETFVPYVDTVSEKLKLAIVPLEDAVHEGLAPHPLASR